MADIVEDDLPEDELAADGTPAQDEAAIERRKRSWPARLARWFLGLVGVLLALVLAAYLILNSPIGQRFVADQIADVAPASGLRFEVGRIEGDLFGNTTLRDVKVLDPDGVWLTIPEVELDWRPLRWFTRGLDVRELVVRRGTMLRTPNLLPGDPDAPVLPDFDISVDRLAIEDLTVAKGIIGNEARLVNFLANAEISGGQAVVKARGELGDRDTLFALLDARPDDDVFDLKLDYRAPAGGVLATLAGQDEDMRAFVSGDGNWERWNGIAKATRGNDNLALLKLTATDGRYTALGKLFPQDLLTGLPAELAGQEVALKAEGDILDRSFDGSVRAVSPAIAFSGAGGIDLAENRVNALRFNARTRRAIAAEGLEASGLSIVGNANGAFRDLTVRHNLSAERLAQGDLAVTQLRQAGVARLEGNRWTVPLDLAAASLVQGTTRAENIRQQGTAVWDGETLTLPLDLRVENVVSGTTRLAGLTQRGTLTYRNGQATVPLGLSLDRAQSGDIVATDIRQSGTARWDGQRLVLPLDLAVGRLVTGNPQFDPRLVDGRARGTVTLAGDTITSDALFVAFPGLNADLSVRGDLGTGAIALAGPVEARGLVLEDLGTVDANARIVFARANGVPWSLRANVAGRMQNVQNATLAAQVGNDIQLRGDVRLGQNQPIYFNDAQVRAAKLNLDVSGQRRADGTIVLTGGGRHVQYGRFTVDADVGRDGPRAALVFENPLPSAGLENVRVALEPIPDGFRIDTEGQSLLGPFEGVVNLYAPAGGPTRVVISEMNVWRTSITGAVTLGGDAVVGDLAFAGGGLDGTVRLLPRGGGQGFDVDLVADDARFAGETPLIIRQGVLRAQGTLADGNQTITGSLRAQGIQRGQLFIGRASAQADVVNGSGNFSGRIAGSRGSRFNLQFVGDMDAGSETRPQQVRVAARGDYAGRALSMPRRAVLTKLDAGGWRLSPTQLDFAGGTMIADGSFGGPTAPDLNVQLDAMPLSLTDIVGLDLGLGGTISGRVDYRPAPSGLPVADMTVKVKGLTRSGLVLSSRPIDVEMVAALTETNFDARAVIDEGGQQRGRLQARIGNLPSSGSLGERLYAGDLLAQLRFRGPAEALWRLAAIEAFDLNGTVGVAADITGSLRQPRVNGSVTADDARLVSSLTGTDVRGITMRGNFVGSRLRLLRFAGTTPNGGQVSGSGTVDLSNLGAGRGPSIDLRAAARNARLVNRQDLTAVVTGPLRIVSSGVGGTIAGRVRIDQASWKLGGAAATERLPRIRTREINLPFDVRPAAQRSAPWRFLIDAAGESRIDVDGLGLDSEWGANIRIRGNTDEMRIGGRADQVRGSYSFAGTRFELERGVIRFDEDAPINPRLDILASTQDNGITVDVAVTGTAQQPDIRFESNPALPQEEILARLLFGDSITDLSATDALQLGAAVASLQGGGGGGLDPINQLRTSLGLDRLRIVSADPALGRGTGVAVGKNLGRRFYVEMITDGRGYTATEVEFQVTSWLALLASISSVGRNSIVAEYRRDY